MFNYLVLAGKKGTTEHAAVWVPDSEASTCMHCFKSKFTALNRRVSVAWLICTYWLNERAGQEKIWLQVICSPPHLVSINCKSETFYGKAWLFSVHKHFITFSLFYASFFFLIQFFLSNCPDLLLRIFLPFFFFDCLTQHHCRKCGGVVCGNCSTKKFLLPAQSSKPLRVCDNCYNVLSSGKTQSDQESKKKSKLNVVCFNRFFM